MTTAPPLLPDSDLADAPLPVRSSSGRNYLRGSRGPLMILGGLIVVAGIALLTTRSASTGGTMDPRSYSPEGARALATLLTDRGVSVVRVNSVDAAIGRANRSASTGSATTVVVADPAREGEDLTPLSHLPAGNTLVLIRPDLETLDDVQPGLRIGGTVDLRTRQLDCAQPEATVAGAVVAGGDSFLQTGTARGVSCYVGTLYQQALLTGGSIIDLGSAATLSNEHLGSQGNAALGLGLLGSHPNVVWLVPGPIRATGTKTLGELLPERVGDAEVQLFIAIGFLMLWRARRLGRVVHEPLPVVVRASETVEGQGRLYHAARARSRAANAMRAATLARMAPRLGIRRDEGTSAMVDAIVARTQRRPTDVTALLYGAEPEDDRALVTLADQLDALEAEVRRS